MLSVSIYLLSEGTHCEVAAPKNNTAGVCVCVRVEEAGDGLVSYSILPAHFTSLFV